MVARDDLERAFAPVAKDDEVSDQRKEPLPVKHAPQQGFHLTWAMRGEVAFSARHGSPWHEAFLIRRQRSDAGQHTIRRDQDRIGSEKGRYLCLVGLKLIESS